jgi:hypothetical protein
MGIELKMLKSWGTSRMQLLIIAALVTITIYTLGFGVTLWKGKQKISALAVFFLTLAIIVLPFYSIF